ncbi:uncharacterized protein LOC144652750 isoform X2 [Oculina patagonica]
MGSVCSVVKSWRNYERELTEWKKMVETQLEEKTKSNEDEQDEKFEIAEMRARVLQSNVSILTSSLRETNKRIEAMASSLIKTENQQKQKSAMINSTRSDLKEFTQKITEVLNNLEKLECKVLKIEKSPER